jgi:acyl-CoA hydrolase
MRALPVVALALLCCSSPTPNLDSTGSTIVCFGDSLTAGVGRGDGATYPEILAEELNEDVVNLGVSGDTAGAALLRIDEVFSHDPWLVVVGLGGNDLLRQISPTTAEASLTEIVDRIVQYGAVPVLIEVRSPFTGGYEDIFDRLAKRGIPIVRDVLAEILADRSLKSDRIHPNSEGYRRLAAAVVETVRPLKERRTGG